MTSATTALAGLVLAAALAAPSAQAAADRAAEAEGPNAFSRKPSFVRGEILARRYDGIADDLLTAGLGKTGLAGAAPKFADAQAPTAAELRRLAIYSNYRALVDVTPGGGYGRLYGPNVTADGVITAKEGLIPGDEFLAFAGNASGRENVTMMVQIPDSFDRARPCIVTAPSSGSRGVYGAIGTAGEWGLKRGCAVAYTDKGTGIGLHDLGAGTVNLITGERAEAAAAGKSSNFTAPVGPGELARFVADNPHRLAVKHANSQQNPEADWGRNVLDSIEFAFYLLNRHRGGGFTPDNTLVIASSVSNGGGASLRAAEQDRRGLIDGIAVGEPNVNPQFNSGFAIVQGEGQPLAEHSRPLIDYLTLVNLYQGCANRDPALAGAPLNAVAAERGAARCASLREAGLLTADGLEAQAAEAQAVINQAGLLTEQNIIQPSHWFLSVPQSISHTYANAYSRAAVTESLCGLGYAAADANGAPAALPPASAAAQFGTSNGVPPSAGIAVMNWRNPGGPKIDRDSVSPSTGRQDENFDGALCLRRLFTGQSLTPEEARLQERLLAGVEQIKASGDLRGLPAVMVTGRSDAILPPNHTSRAYYGLNQLVEGGRGNLRYYEVTNAQHLDALNGLPGYDSRFIPLHYYYIKALDLMHDHLTQGRALPPSQVIRTTPRGLRDGAAPPVEVEANLPPILDNPGAAAITFAGGMLRIPE